MIITALALFVVGIAFMFNGLQMRKKRLQLGSTWGFRNEDTTVSEAVWKQSHVSGGLTVMVAGLGAEIAGAILLLFPSSSVTMQTVVSLCGLAWVVMLYVAAKGRVTETAARINRINQREAEN
ncbi:hypothetical protein [Corynebacterium sp.]|uniref:hypothetical protein n=1 Tax=Corynebacterium sp. TaxID=1720 RepID=UPI0028AFBA69|nr:hypothetical protein [Corynebacterium sp.]